MLTEEQRYKDQFIMVPVSIFTEQEKGELIK